jgi:AbrB family looped-hinge helix DNA binding protein
MGLAERSIYILLALSVIYPKYINRTGKVNKMRRILQKNNTSNYCIIPSEIIEDLNLKTGDKLDFSIEGDHIKVMPIHTSAKMNVQAATHTSLKGVDAHDRIQPNV